MDTALLNNELSMNHISTRKVSPQDAAMILYAVKNSKFLQDNNNATLMGNIVTVEDGTTYSDMFVINNSGYRYIGTEVKERY